MERTRLNGKDLWFVAGLCMLTAAYVPFALAPALNPYEDAAMLMRYSKHLAEGRGIVWNIGEAPLDGATDFLFMVLLAGLKRAGLSLEAGVRILGVGAHVLTVLLIYAAIRHLHGISRRLAALSAAYLALGPGLGLVACGFGTPVFVLLVALSWCLANRLARGEGAARPAALFSVSCLVMGLIRPEGVFLAIFMLIGVVLWRGFRDSRSITAIFAAVFVVLGGAYFCWRWSYFGHPLPNPYYMKGGHTLHFWSLEASIENVVVLCLPFIPAFILGLRSPKGRRETLFALIPVLGFTGLWILISGDMNVLRRFQYPVLPIVLMSWPGMISGLCGELGLRAPDELARPHLRTMRAVALAAGLAVLAHAMIASPLWKSRVLRDGKHDVAELLRPFGGRGYTLVTTEAGLLPLYSEWRSIDAWGLNDRWIARHGAISESYLEAAHPELIMFHEFFSPLVPPAGSGRWYAMVMTLKKYAETHDYRLVAAFGVTPYDTHYYYVRRDFPDSAAISDTIRGMEYYWSTNGNKAVDFAALAPCSGKR
jgi:arabinofuranosyltransferase